MSDELERQLEAFGATLESSTGEPIRKDTDVAVPSSSVSSPRRWALAGAAACLLAVVVGLLVVTGRDAEAPTAQPPTPTSTPFDAVPGAGDSSGLGAFEPLVGVGAVVEATVVGFRGPRAVANAYGAVDYPDRSENAAEWTTPFGLPVIVVGEIELVAPVGGSGRADTVANDVREAIEAGADVEVLAPVGIYREGERYELWLGAQQDLGYMAYLAFDGSGATIDGLGIQDADAVYARLSEHTGEGRVESLAAMARELNAAWDGGAGQGELMDFVYGPEEVTSEDQPSEFYEGTSDATAEDDGRVDLDVWVVGAEPEVVYGLRGSRLLGWFTAGADGHLSLRGWVPPGEELQLVTTQTSGGSVDVVAEIPTLIVDAESKEFRAFADLDDEPTSWQTGLSLGELDTLVRSDLGLPPEAVHDDPLALERDGWTLVQRSTEPFTMTGDNIPCPSATLGTEYDGAQQVHDIMTPPEGTGLDLDVYVLDVGEPPRGDGLATSIVAIGRCLAEFEGIDVESGAMSSIRATWFRAGPDFALVAIVGEGSRSVVLEIEGASFDDDLIGELAHRADQFLRGAPVSAGDTSDDGQTAMDRPEIPRRQMTAAEEERFANDETWGLACDERGVGGTTWDYGPIGPDDVEGRMPVDEFWGAVDENARDMEIDGGVPYPRDGWTELVQDEGSSLFVLEVDGLPKARIDVSGDPESGVWRRGSSTACQSLFIP